MRAGAFLVFHGLRLRRFHPALLAVAGVTSVLLLVSAGSVLVQARKVAAGRAALAAQAHAARAPAAPAGMQPLNLPPFDATVLIAAIEQASLSAQVNTDGFAFAVEDTAGLPYRRYRASMEMVGRYPQIRAAIAGVLREVPSSALSAVKCMRDDIGEADVRCTVVMSAFYRRAPS